MINNINTYSNLFNTNASTSSTTSTIDEIIAENKQTAIEQTEQTGGDNANIYLSTRAQKIDLLSREFFSGGDLNFSDIDSLKERVYQLGLISKEDYSRLTGADLSTQSLDNAEELPNQTLVNFIGDFLSRIEQAEVSQDDNADKENIAEESEIITLLKEALSSAQTMLSNIEKAKVEPDFKESLANTLTIFKDTINTDSFEKFSLDDKVGLTKTYQALDIVDKISPQRLSNDKLNRYIEIGLT